MFHLDPVYLQDLAAKHHGAYSQASPFPHVVIDNFLPEPVLDDVLAEFPTAGAIDWQRLEHAGERKLANRDEQYMGDHTRLLLYQLNSSVFIDFLESLTG